MYAVVDIETTGSRFGDDRITEIGVVLCDGERVEAEWSSLVHPGRAVPAFISSLTGIDDALLADAPPFEQIAATVEELTRSCVFVAHNAAFDYHFLRKEFERCGLLYERKRLCTVRVSRKIFPGLPSYSLGRLCEQLGIEHKDRHRALGDARATAQLLHMLVDNDRRGVLQSALQHGSGERNLPPHLPLERFLALPQRTGVYYMLDRQGKVVYVGKARNLRQRVAAHFAAAERSPAEARLRHLTADLRWEETGNELVALLLESAEIKRLQPVCNAAQKSWQATYHLTTYQDQRGYERLAVVKGKPGALSLASFPDPLSARNHLRELCREHELCPRFCGLQSVFGACYDRRAGTCRGACQGEESPSTYNERVLLAMQTCSLQLPNALLLGKGRHAGERSVVGIENGRYLGFGFFEPGVLGMDSEAIRGCLRSQPNTAEAQRIVQAYLRSAAEADLLPISADGALHTR